MSLFTKSELATTNDTADHLFPKSYRQPYNQPKTGNSHQIIKSRLELAATIGELVPDEAIQFSTGGRWSLHQLLEYVLHKTGPAKIWMTTWTITEEPMRVLLHLLRSGNITELHAVFDYRIEKRKPEAFQLASNILTRIKLTKCHAKVLVIQNEDWNVTVLGSANFSNNPRVEAGTIFTDRGSAEFNKGWINDLIEGKEVFRGK